MALYSYTCRIFVYKSRVIENFAEDKKTAVYTPASVKAEASVLAFSFSSALAPTSSA